MNTLPINTHAFLKSDELFVDKKTPKTTMPFENILTQAIHNIESAAKTKNADSIALSMGETDNLAQVQINAQKYSLAVSSAVEMRNKILEAYQEIMRINV